MCGREVGVGGVVLWVGREGNEEGGGEGVALLLPLLVRFAKSRA